MSIKIEIGQRWKYNSNRYIWVVEVTDIKGFVHYYDQTKIVQIIKQPPDESHWKIGSQTGMDPSKSDLWTYLEGQDK